MCYLDCAQSSHLPHGKAIPRYQCVWSGAKVVELDPRDSYCQSHFQYLLAPICKPETTKLPFLKQSLLGWSWGFQKLVLRLHAIPFAQNLTESEQNYKQNTLNRHFCTTTKRALNKKGELSRSTMIDFEMAAKQKNTQQVRIGLIQGREKGSAQANLTYTIDRIIEAAAGGAQIICTQELFTTPYFCITQDTTLFDLAEPIPGPTSTELAGVAKELGVVIIASLFERRGPGVYHNTAVVIDADGSHLGMYRKMHIPQDPGFEEKFYFTPGDLGFRVWATKFGKISVLICWDQWFPEAARLAALAGAEIIFYPTAIGWLPEEKAELGEAQHIAWETVQRGHAVANGCYVAAVNRTGTEAGTEFWGQSFVSDFYGQIIQRAGIDEESIVLADCDLTKLEATRRIWPFLRDRRIESYGDITRRMID